MARELVASAAHAAFEAARRRRAALAGMSIEEKLEVLLELQRLASAVVAASGRPARQPWQVAKTDGTSREPGSSD